MVIVSTVLCYSVNSLVLLCQQSCVIVSTVLCYCVNSLVLLCQQSCVIVSTILCYCLATGLWFYPGTPVSSTNKTDRYDIALNTLNLTLSPKTPLDIDNTLIFVFLCYCVNSLVLLCQQSCVIVSTVLCYCVNSLGI
jgi:hypothetical protein